MYINRRTFNIRPGCMDSAIGLIKDEVAYLGEGHFGDGPVRLMTAEFGGFDVLIMETMHETISGYETAWKNWMESDRPGPFFEKWNQLIERGDKNELWLVR